MMLVLVVGFRVAIALQHGPAITPEVVAATNAPPGTTATPQPSAAVASVERPAPRDVPPTPPAQSSAPSTSVASAASVASKPRLVRGRSAPPPEQHIDMRGPSTATATVTPPPATPPPPPPPPRPTPDDPKSRMIDDHPWGD